MSLADELTELIEPLARSNGLELVAVDVLGGARNRTVRIFLDKDGGIDIETIAQANDWIGPALDTVERLSGPYTLEVSSPGIERPLRTRAHFERFAGRAAVVTTTTPIGGRSRFTGTLTGVDGNDVLIDVDGNTHRVPLDAIARARLKADLSLPADRSGREA